MNISVVIPCFNEEQGIGAVLDALSKDIYEVIVVNNNSTDRTSAIALEKGARIVDESRPGYGFAIKAGLIAAKGDLIAVLDGDGQYPAQQVTEMAEFLEKNNYDFVSGSRFPLSGGQSMSSIRKLGNYLLTLAANIVFCLKLKDLLSGMWVFKRSVLEKINLKSNGTEFSEEITIKAATNKSISFAEYHINYFPRYGESKLSPLRDGMLNLIFMLRIKFFK